MPCTVLHCDTKSKDSNVSSYSLLPLLSIITANTRRWPNVIWMLAHRLRSWFNIQPTLAQRLVFAGILLLWVKGRMCHFVSITYDPLTSGELITLTWLVYVRTKWRWICGVATHSNMNMTANTGRSLIVVSMLGRRRRRWANIETTLGECPEFAGISPRLNKGKHDHVRPSFTQCRVI